jgi:hypothetical protein
MALSKDEAKKAFIKKYKESLDDEQIKKIGDAINKMIDNHSPSKEDNLISNEQYVLPEIVSDNPGVVTWDIVCEVIRYHLPATAEWINDHRVEEFRVNPVSKKIYEEYK